jgi:ferredoxin
LAPAVYEPDDMGHCALVHDEVPADFEQQARTGVAACPEDALTLDD